MGVFRKENAAAQLFWEPQQQEKCSKDAVRDSFRAAFCINDFERRGQPIGESAKLIGAAQGRKDTTHFAGNHSYLAEVILMRGFKYLLIAVFALLFVSAVPAAPAAHAQVTFGVNIGPEPVCPYGYYGYAPYRCAPYGYYGPEWFNGGVFIGAGRWHHGPAFYGNVNRTYDPRFGYHGGYPARGEHFDNHHDFHDFHGTHMADHSGHYRNGPHKH